MLQKLHLITDLTLGAVFSKIDTHCLYSYIQKSGYCNDSHAYIANADNLHSTNAGTTTAESFTYDVNGNMKTESAPSQSNCTFVSDGSTRLRVISDTHTMQNYIYDSGAERVLKATSLMSSVYENSTPVNSSINFSIYTTYPSAFIVVNSNGQYSKHYYAGSQRIVQDSRPACNYI